MHDHFITWIIFKLELKEILEKHYRTKWGGCSCHDILNIFNAGVTKLNCNLKRSCIVNSSYLSIASIHRLREYEGYCHSLGLVTQRYQTFLFAGSKH